MPVVSQQGAAHPPKKFEILNLLAKKIRGILLLYFCLAGRHHGTRPSTSQHLQLREPMCQQETCSGAT